MTPTPQEQQQRNFKLTVEKHSTIDKSFDIRGFYDADCEWLAQVDFDDVNHPEVNRWTTYIVRAVNTFTKLTALVATQKEYIELLARREGELQIFASVHGQYCTEEDSKKGTELRQRIEALQSPKP